ncbi:MAG: hypothetical protein JW779_02385 [Candidatus Thorarchaeota archaeon]|nr:hypothetical protein [Candidatus Thorarchaeota archaeon]
MKFLDVGRRKYKVHAVIGIVVISIQLLTIIQPTGEISRFNQSMNGEVTNTETYDNHREMSVPSQLENAQWISLDSSVNPGTVSGSEVISSDASGITIRSHFYGFWQTNDTLNGTHYDVIDMPGASLQMTPSNPSVPWLNEFVEIPHGINVTVDITYFETHIFEGYWIIPTQMPLVSLPEPTIPVFVKNDTLYNEDKFYPNYNITCIGDDAESPIIIRGRRLLEIGISPIQFNPDTRQLRGYSLLEIQIYYTEPAQIVHVDASLYSEAFESIYQDILLNYQDWSSLPSGTVANNNYQTNSESTTADFAWYDSVQYLIITYPDFYPAAKKLADWKTRKGIPAEVVTTDVIYSDSSVIFDNPPYGVDIEIPKGQLFDKIEDMKEWILNQFTEHNVKPSYVLLLGDSNHIPCDYNISHKANFYQNDQFLPVHGPIYANKIATDVTYFCVMGKDYFPDMIHGRISVEDIDEANSVIEKILAYEQQPIENDPFYANVLTTGYFQDWYDTSYSGNPDGREDEEFIQTAENISNYIRTLPYLVPYTVHINYTTDTGVTPSYLYDGITPVNPNIDWTASTSDVVDNINEGRFIVFHIDHGTSRNFYWWYRNDWPNTFIGRFDGWAAPYFTTDYINQLNNENRLPLLLCMECNTGWFDGETDGLIDEGFLNQYQLDCFAEEIAKLPTTGAIAAIASTRSSFNSPAADLSIGITNSFWPGIIERPYFFILPFTAINNLGVALYRAKAYVSKLYNGITDTQNQGNITQLVYHLLGDPDTPLWTQNPKKFIVEYPYCLEQGTTHSVVVRVMHESTAVRRAMVCLQKDTEVYLVGYTNNLGEVTFEIDPMTLGVMNITVTKQNFIPIIKQISVSVVCPILLAVIGGIALVVIVVIIIYRKRIGAS